MNPLFIISSILGILGLVICYIIFNNKDDKKDFLRFCKKFIIYSIPTIIITVAYIILMYPKRESLNGISMSDQLIQNFENSINSNYTTYIFGNSRCYRGIDPDLLSTSTFNFAYDNETFLEQYYKLQYLNKNKIVPDTIILGVDYFEFSFVSEAMTDTYKQYFSKEYITSINEYNSANSANNKNKTENIDDYVNATLSNIFGRSASQYVNYLYNYIVYHRAEAPYLKKNGQYIINPVPKGREGDFVKRDTTILNIQKEYFEKIISYSKANNIIVFLVMPPTRNIERKSYSDNYITNFDKYFIEKCEKNKIFYINYFNVNFDLSLFMDDTHLTPNGASVFSNLLNNDIKYFQHNNKTYLFVK